MASSTHLSAFEGDLFFDPTLFHNTIGTLQYLCITRSDISFYVNKLAQFMNNPTGLHWQAVKRLLRNLKETVQFGVQFNQSPPATIQAYSNVDWEGDCDDHRSTSGYCIFLGTNLISWSYHKQNIVAVLSTEAEYKALANTTAELSWIMSLCSKLGLRFTHPPTL
jgi:hypothetical protein